MRNIVILGGSFDCVHKGHIEILKKAIKELNADEGWFMIAKTPRWKDDFSSLFERLKLLKIVCKKEKNLKICDLETKTEGINYTYDTILKLKELYPEDNFYFLIGADQIAKLDKWYQIDKLKDLIQIVGIGRGGYELNKENIERYNVQMIDYNGPLISSSAFKETLNLELLPSYLHNEVLKSAYYYKKKLRKNLTYKRYKHSLQVASLAKKIALSNNVDPTLTYISALLHDAAKDIDHTLELEIMKQYYSEHLDEARVIYHQYVGEYIVKNHYGINNKEVLEAIKYHTSGKEDMSKIAKIVYAADKIEPTRGYDSSNLIKACLEDLETGFLLVLKDNYKFLTKKGVDITNAKDTLKCFEYYNVYDGK